MLKKKSLFAKVVLQKLTNHKEESMLFCMFTCLLEFNITLTQRTQTLFHVDIYIYAVPPAESNIRPYNDKVLEKLKISRVLISQNYFPSLCTWKVGVVTEIPTLLLVCL